MTSETNVKNLTSTPTRFAVKILEDHASLRNGAETDREFVERMFLAAARSAQQVEEPTRPEPTLELPLPQEMSDWMARQEAMMQELNEQNKEIKYMIRLLTLDAAKKPNSTMDIIVKKLISSPLMRC